MSEHILGVSGSAATLSLSLLPGFFPQGHSRRPTEYRPTPSFEQEHLLLSHGKLTCSPQSSWKGMEDNYYMLPLDASKAPQGKTLELGRSRPAKGRGKKGRGSSPVARTERPLPRPESRGNAHPGSEQERKRHCADRGGSFPKPQGG